MAQSVVADGGTSTTVSLAPDGRISVGLAPADAASVSHNTFSSFSVGKRGVDLDNGSARASLIINEVTSTNPTSIEGPLTVIGTKADVIIANPNGITVNGGKFLNTGNLALTTGSIHRGAGGSVTTSVSSGRIEIGREGLSGAMEELALLSAALSVSGSLEYDQPSSRSHVNVITGSATTGFDKSRGGFGVDGTGQLPWAMAVSRDGTATNAIVVDITESGSISAGRISVTVTGDGAGVRFAGDQLAAAGGFRLSSSGRLDLVGSKIQAKSGVAISAKDLRLSSRGGRRGEVSSDTSGVVLEAATGNIELGDSRISGKTVSSDNFASSGGVTLIAAGDITSVSNGGSVATLTSEAIDTSSLQRTSHVVLIAQGGMHFEGLDVSATDDLRLTADKAISFSASSGRIGADFRVFSQEQVEFDATKVTAGSDIRIDGASLRFGADQADQSRTELKAVEGGFLAASAIGGISNFGSLLQGKTVIAEDPSSLGAATIISAAAFHNKSLSIDRLAVVFGEVGRLHVAAQGDVINETARLFSNDGITIQAGGDLINKTGFSGDISPLSVSHLSGKRFSSSLFLKREQTTRVSATFGKPLINGEQSLILGVGDVELVAGNIQNIGAGITGASVAITATDLFRNEAAQVGQMSYTQRCRWFCKMSGSSDLRLLGGTVIASEALSISAGTQVINRAGSLSGVTGVTISAPHTEFMPAFSAQLLEHPAGLTGMFQGRRGHLLLEYWYGEILSEDGDIVINGDAELAKSDLEAAGDVTITGTHIESDRPGALAPFKRKPLGLLWSIF